MTLRTVRMFQEDRLLCVATLVLAISVLTPLWMSPFLPLVDLGSTVGAANLLNDAAFGSGLIARHFFVNFKLVPYWTVYLVLAALEPLVGPLIAVKVVLGAIVVGMPIAAMRLLLALGRSPRLGLWVFILSWDTNLYWGWVTFHAGMIAALIVLAWLIEMRTLRDALKLLSLTLFIALTHVHAVVLVLVAGGLLALSRRPFWPNMLRHAVALAGSVVVLLPWLWDKLLGSKARAAGSYSFEIHPLQQKLRSVFAYTIDNMPDAGNATAIGFALIVAGAAGFALLKQRNVDAQRRLGSALIVMATAGLYFGLPFAIWGPIYHWFTYPRYATYLLIALLALPRPDLQRWNALTLLPGIAAALFIHRGVAAQFEAYGQYVAPYAKIIAALPEHSRFFPLDIDDYRFKGTHEAVLGQLHGYAAAVKSSYDPHLFDEPNNPLLYRHEVMLPAPDWRRQSEFTMERQGQYYDYVIVHPLDRDPFVRNPREAKGVTLVTEAGHWRLYKVNAPRSYPPGR